MPLSPIYSQINQQIDLNNLAQSQIIQTSLEQNAQAVGQLNIYRQIMSVNQLASNIKLTEVWKATNNSEYPVQLTHKKPEGRMNNFILRPSTIRTWKEACKTKIAKESFTYDAAKIWNKLHKKKNV